MKKTIKEHPITFFRKANEAKQAVVKKSMKKAQDGIEMNDDMINKAGSTGGYKKPLEKYKPWEGQVELKQPIPMVRYDNSLSPEKATNKFKTDTLNAVYPNFQIDPSSFSKPKALSERISKIKQKTGGSVKRKK
jgi:hypothetical protein